jgi:hypothetical protein
LTTTSVCETQRGSCDIVRRERERERETERERERIIGEKDRDYV